MEGEEEHQSILSLFSMIMVLPMSTAVVERGFSTTKRIKTDWRSRLETDMLSKLMYISKGAKSERL